MSDIPALETLINRSYLFDEGWTNEAELVGAIRTDAKELTSVINDTQQHLFVYPQTDNGHEIDEILGCINVAIEDNSAYIGFFAVNPDLQGSGVGSAMLKEAEKMAQHYLPHSKLTVKQASSKPTEDKSIKILVLNGRDKMLAYYQRRGYVCNGNSQSFSENSNDYSNGSEAKNKVLYFIEIEKVSGSES